MAEATDLETLAVRTALTDVVTAYAMALDARDWAGFEALFETETEIDYSSLGSLNAILPAKAWADRCRVLGAFDATQHKVGNFVFKIDGDRAEVTSYVDAAHFIAADGETLEAHCLGTYRHRLRRGPDGWRIQGCTLIVAGYRGGRETFDRAFDAARARFAATGDHRP